MATKMHPCLCATWASEGPTLRTHLGVHLELPYSKRSCRLPLAARCSPLHAQALLALAARTARSSCPRASCRQMTRPGLKPCCLLVQHQRAWTIIIAALSCGWHAHPPVVNCNALERVAADDATNRQALILSVGRPPLIAELHACELLAKLERAWTATFQPSSPLNGLPCQS